MPQSRRADIGVPSKKASATSRLDALELATTTMLEDRLSEENEPGRRATLLSLISLVTRKMARVETAR